MDSNQREENAPPRILRKPQVIERTGLCGSSIDNRERSNDFPARVNLGGRAVGWVESEIEDWLLEKIRSSRA